MIKRERTIDSIGDRSPYVAAASASVEKREMKAVLHEKGGAFITTEESDAIGTPLYGLL